MNRAARAYYPMMKLTTIAIATLLAVTGSARADAKPGVDFASDAKRLYQIAACGDGPALADPKVQKVVDHHCKVIHEHMDGFKTTYFDKGRAWFDAVVPKDAPKTVVYPFGGGDL